MQSAPPPDEYAAAHSGAAVIQTRWLGSLAVEGSDAADWLQRITTAEVNDLKAGSGTPTLFLDDRGRIQCECLLLAEAQRFALWTQSARLETLRQRLELLHFSEDVSLVPQRHSALLLVGPAATVALAHLGIAARPEGDFDHRNTDWNGAPLSLVREPRYGLPGVWILAASERLSALAAELVNSGGATSAGESTYETIRIEAGVPRFGVDILPTSFPAEVRLESACALSKGCFPGSETVARMDSYGGPQKRLMGLQIEGADSDFAAEIEFEGRRAGQVTSRCFSPALASVIALAMLKKSCWDPGTELSLRGPRAPLRARVAELPMRGAVRG